jgi:hypothetical protein
MGNFFISNAMYSSNEFQVHEGDSELSVRES